jgi:hypothetical protein
MTTISNFMSVLRVFVVLMPPPESFSARVHANDSNATYALGTDT